MDMMEEYLYLPTNARTKMGEFLYKPTTDMLFSLLIIWPMQTS